MFHWTKALMNLDFVDIFSSMILFFLFTVELNRWWSQTKYPTASLSVDQKRALFTRARDAAVCKLHLNLDVRGYNSVKCLPTSARGRGSREKKCLKIKFCLDIGHETLVMILFFTKVNADQWILNEFNNFCNKII